MKQPRKFSENEYGWCIEPDHWPESWGIQPDHYLNPLQFSLLSGFSNIGILTKCYPTREAAMAAYGRTFSGHN